MARAARQGIAHFALPREGKAWLHLRLDSPVPELVAPAFGRTPRLALLDVLRVFERVGSDPRIAGVVLRLTGPVGGTARAQSLRRAVDQLREAGKPVVAWSEGFDAETYQLASGATRVYLPKSGSLMLVGLRLESLHVKQLLDRVGVRADVLSVGAYKSAGERFTRSAMSPENREQLEALADDLYEGLLGAIAVGRGLERDAVEARVDAGPYAAAAAVDAGLIDGVRYPDEIEEELASLVPETALAPGDGRPRLVDAATYAALCVDEGAYRSLGADPPRIAYVVGRGAIRRGRGHRGLAADSMRALLDRMRRDEGVAAVVLRLDSRGGEAVASELVWRSARLLAEAKPLVVCMGDVAASGGYFIAAAGAEIVAEPGTLTGSIGVIGLRPDTEELFDKLGVTRDGVERGAHAGLLAAGRGFAPEERAAYRDILSSIHGTFAARVAEGRDLSDAEVGALATGRVWSGREARGLGLVDRIGGPLEAIATARERAGLSPEDRYALSAHPRLPPAPAWLALAGGRDG